MSLSETEENLVIWGGASLLLLLITIISYISYRIFLPKKMAKKKRHMDELLTLRSTGVKLAVLSKIRPGGTDAQINPEDPGKNTSPSADPLP